MSDKKPSNGKSSGVQVISRAAEILRLLGRDTSGLSLGRIAAQVDLPRSTVQRIVSALADEGFVASAEKHGQIRLGPAIRSLAPAAVEDFPIRIRPVMMQLAEESGETVDLAILDGNKMRFVDQIIGDHRLRTVSSIGDTFPLTCTANGKAALALLPDDEANALIQRELAGQKNIKQRRQILVEEIAAIRNGKLATDENEHTDGICAMGIAFSDVGTIYALSIPVPATRYERSKDQLTKMMRKLLPHSLHES